MFSADLGWPGNSSTQQQSAAGWQLPSVGSVSCHPLVQLLSHHESAWRGDLGVSPRSLAE